ncbi:MAG: aminopeptidase [Planctomycetia bacterium]|nr:aminopeptidase [Planctomycetia bacterium]
MKNIEEIHAQLLIDYSVNLKSKEKVCIRGSVACLPLMHSLFDYALTKNAFPQLKIFDEHAQKVVLKYGNKKQISYVPESEMTLMKDIDVLINIVGSVNVRHLTNINPAKIKLQNQGKKAVLNTFFTRVKNKELRFAVTLYPTQSDAQEASMSLSDYRKLVYNACKLYTDDPAKEWQDVSTEQERICSFLNTNKVLHIISSNTDLTMSIKGRKWINCDGKVNLPDGEIYTGPVEKSVNGYIHFSFPGIYASREIGDIHLTFKNGKVVGAKASKGEDLLLQLLETDKGARYVGEIAIGTNDNITQFTKNILFDEKIGGTIHLAIGRSAPESGGLNKSSIHWDMLCDMKKGGEIYADDELIYKNGKFTI